MLKLFKRREPETHDFSRRYWGHDYVFNPIDGGKRGDMQGWGEHILPGDYLILQNVRNETTRYKVKSITYYTDPDDMWEAKVVFAPRRE
jgi:MioC protein